MKIELRDTNDLWITFDPAAQDYREVIIDKEKDIRICDGTSVVKVRFTGKTIRDVLVNDVFVYSKPS